MADPIGPIRPGRDGRRLEPRMAGMVGLGGVALLAVALVASGGLLASGGDVGGRINGHAGPAATSPNALDPTGSVATSPIRIGAVFPLTGDAAPLAKEELLGVQLGADFVNADGGVVGRRIVLEVRDLESADQAPQIMES